MIDLTRVSDEEINREYWRRVRTHRVSSGRPKKILPCPTCGKQCGARELREHKPQCTGKGQKA
jgi:hypothetical protein